MWKGAGRRQGRDTTIRIYSMNFQFKKKKTKKELVLTRLSPGSVSLELSWSLSQRLGHPDGTVSAVVSYFIESLK